MRRLIFCLSALLPLVSLGALAAETEYASRSRIYYTRCNLRVLDGKVPSVNWQAEDLKILPVNTRVELLPNTEWVPTGPGGVTRRQVTRFSLRDVSAGVTYPTTFDLDVPASIEKILASEPVQLSGWDAATRDAIRKGVFFVGMAKEAAYVALGPPPEILTEGRKVSSAGVLLQDILAAEYWFYARRRHDEFRVHFDPVKNTVDRME